MNKWKKKKSWFQVIWLEIYINIILFLNFETHTPTETKLEKLIFKNLKIIINFTQIYLRITNIKPINFDPGYRNFFLKGLDQRSCYWPKVPFSKTKETVLQWKRHVNKSTVIYQHLNHNWMLFRSKVTSERENISHTKYLPATESKTQVNININKTAAVLIRWCEVMFIFN